MSGLMLEDDGENRILVKGGKGKKAPQKLKATESVHKELFSYDKRHGWREKDNYQDIFSEDQITSLNDLDTSFLFNDTYFSDINFDENIISNRINNIFDLYPYSRSGSNERRCCY